MPLHPDLPPDPPNWPPDWQRRRLRLHRLGSGPSNFPHQKPDWWPVNEPWPPRRGQLRHNPFFRRLGCLFALFNLMAWTLFLIVVGFVAHIFGLIHLSPISIQWTVPVGAIVFIVLVAALLIVGQALRRSFSPLDQLLSAAERVTEGDYTVRVAERGPGAMRSLVRTFNTMAARLRQTDEHRRNLMADVTHELRTPLTVIQGNLEGMLDGVYPADESNLRALLDETQLLSRLIDDLRTLALAESGALQLKKEPTDPLLLLRETVGAFQAQADTAGVTLTVTGAALPPIPLDPGRMRQVFSNLIANALRYSPAGAQVMVSAAQVKNQVQIEVRDSGPGIPAEDLPHIFERFYKAADSGRKVPHDSGGMGLGLAIARHLVMAHGGTISAESTPGTGTTIRVVVSGES